MVGSHGSPYIEVLRLGHRPDRDKRITTHVSLVARAFGATGIHVDTRDPKLEETIDKVTGNFGGDFFIRTGVSRKGVLEKWNGTIIHLTMYGMPLDEAAKDIPKDEKLLVVVGAEKVPRDVFDLAHFNVSVGNQPHSEVSALALFLDRMFEGKELSLQLDGGEIKIEPNRFNKTVNSENAKISDPFIRTWSSIPDPEEALELLVSLGCSRSVITHVKIVRDLGMEMVRRSGEADPDRNLDLDLEMLEAGLLLHDIGRSVTHSIIHITHGATIAKRIGLDDRILGMIHNHIGAGVTRKEAVELGLPDEDHLPMTLAERIVCHADTLVGDRKRKTLEEAVDKLRRKGAHAGAERMIRLHHDLEEELGIDIDALLP